MAPGLLPARPPPCFEMVEAWVIGGLTVALHKPSIGQNKPPIPAMYGLYQGRSPGRCPVPSPPSNHGAAQLCSSGAHCLMPLVLRVSSYLCTSDRSQREPLQCLMKHCSAGQSLKSLIHDEPWRSQRTDKNHSEITKVCGAVHHGRGGCSWCHRRGQVVPVNA